MLFFDITTLIGIVGTLVILIAFFLNQIGRWGRDELRYDAFNALGSGVLVVYAWFIGSVPFLVLNFAWFAVSLRDVWKKRSTVRLDVPFFSQHDAEVDERWRKETCTIVNLKMALAYYGEKIDTVGLIEEGEIIGGYLGEKIGWDHEAIVRLARNHGVSAYRQEFRSKSAKYEEELTREGLEKLALHSESGNVVLVSVRNNFDASRGFHTILLVGVKRDAKGGVASFMYHDPDNADREGAYQSVDRETFCEHWRKLCIFFEG